MESSKGEANSSMEGMISPCAHCPWRKSNHGKPHPHGWYSRKNLRRLWIGLRTGRAPGMTCHPTDTDNLVPEGSLQVPEGTEKKECAGALLLITRELRLLEKDPKGYIKANRGRGLTKDGIAWWALARCQFANVPHVGGPPIPIIEEDSDIGLPDHVRSKDESRISPR